MISDLNRPPPPSRLMNDRTVDETLSGNEVITFIQKDMSDQFYGPGVDGLRKKLRELKDSKK